MITFSCSLGNLLISPVVDFVGPHSLQEELGVKSPRRGRQLVELLPYYSASQVTKMVLQIILRLEMPPSPTRRNLDWMQSMVSALWIEWLHLPIPTVRTSNSKGGLRWDRISLWPCVQMERQASWL